LRFLYLTPFDDEIVWLVHNMRGVQNGFPNLN
jgi:hypothetical protein